MEQMNLLEAFGITVPTQKKEEKKKADKSTSDKKDSKKKSSKSVEKMYALPVRIMVPYCGTVTLTADKLSGKEKLSVKEVEEAVRGMEEYAFLSSTVYGFKNIDDNCFAFYYRECNVVSKGTISIQEGCTARIGNEIYDVSAVIEDEETGVDVLRECVSKHEEGLAMADFIYDEDENTLHIIPMGNVLEKPELALKGVKTFDTLTRISVTMEELRKFWIEKGNEADEFTLSYLLLKDFVSQYTECSDLCIVGETVIAVVKPEVQESKKEKGTIYPVKDIMVSFGWDSFLLSEVAGGKEELTEDELKAIIEIRHPEYSKERTRIVFDEKSKMILPLMTGGTKGCTEVLLPVITIAEAEELWNGEKTGVAILKADDRRYRVEKTPVLKVAASMNGDGKGAAWLIKGKISGKVKEVIERFFVLWTMEHDCEVMVQLYYDNEKGEIFIHLPEQVVNKASIRYKLSEELQIRIAKGEIFPVADIHSHGKIMAFFSQIDNCDEKATRLYGVFGGMRRLGNMDFCVRAGAGGNFVNMEPLDVFNEDMFADKLDRDRLAQVLFEKAKQSVFF